MDFIFLQKGKQNTPSSFQSSRLAHLKRHWSDHDTQMYRAGYPVSGPLLLSLVTLLSSVESKTTLSTECGTDLCQQF